jgi:biopolymer transport protein ExbB
MNLLTILQAAPEVAATTEITTESYWDLMLKGGYTMIPLGLMLVLAIYLIIERLIVINKASKEDTSFMNRIKDYIHEGKIESAVNLCKQTNTPSARMIEKGISRLGRPMSDVLVAIENVANMEISKLEKGFGIVATVAGGGPMLGFYGTVIGMVDAFHAIASKGDNTIVLSDLAGGIYTAMVTTVAGLLVGMIAYFGYNYLNSRVNNVISTLEARNMEFLDMLNEPA